MTTPDPIFFNDGVLTVDTQGAAAVGDDDLIAGIRGITITPGYETNELYTADSAFRETVKQYEHSVAVEIDTVDFDVTMAQEWLGGDGSTATASTDTSDPQLFKIELVSPNADGSLERTVAVEKIVFPEMPIVDGSQDEFEEYNLSGTGRSVTQLEDTSA